MSIKIDFFYGSKKKTLDVDIENPISIGKYQQALLKLDWTRIVLKRGDIRSPKKMIPLRDGKRGHLSLQV